MQDSYNLLSLEDFRRIISYNPFHFWGLGASSKAPLDSKCNTIVRQHAWQAATAAGRQEMREAIAKAETLLAEFLQYSVAPKFYEETIEYPKFYDASMARASSADATAHWASVTTTRGFVQAVGVESVTVLNNAAAVTYSDTDGDGLNDTFTATVATTETDAARIAIYFSSADRLDAEGVNEQWRIQPVTVSISGGVVSVRGRSWMLVKPVLYEGVTPTTNGLNPETASNFVTTVSICKRYTNGNGTTVNDSQGVFVWETPPFPSWASCNSPTLVFSNNATDPASIATAMARVGIRDSGAGLLMPGAVAYDATTGVYTGIGWGTARPPDRVIIRYYAGQPLDEKYQMKEFFKGIVARLALAELTERISACDVANRNIYHWQFDLARTSGNADEAFGSINSSDLNNPLGGTRRGHVYAWRMVKQLGNIKGLIF